MFALLYEKIKKASSHKDFIKERFLTRSVWTEEGLILLSQLRNEKVTLTQSVQYLNL